MTGLFPVRHAPTRIALCVRAAVFVAALALVGQATAQGARPQYRPPPPRYANRPQPQYRPQPARPQQFRQQLVQPQQQAVRPMEQPAQRPGAPGALVNPGHPGQMAQHLGSWMEAHSNLPLAQQHQALENEPGFKGLQPAEQERLHNQLTKLNSMPPAQRDRRIRYDETMERLAPPQRQQVRNALGQLGVCRRTANCRFIGRISSCGIFLRGRARRS